MKRTFFTLAIFFVLALAPSAAQDVSLGFRGGIVIPNSSLDSAVDASARQGFVLGAFAKFDLFSLMAFQIEAQYAQKQITVTTVSGPTPTSAVYTLNYLELPLNFRIDLLSGSPTIYGSVGTNVGTILSAFADASGRRLEVSDSVNRFNLGLELGGGIEVELDEDLFMIGDVRYTYGLTNISSETGSLLRASSWRSRDIRITTGLYYTL